MKLKAEDIFGLWHQIEEELGDQLTLQNPGYGFGICLEARGAQVLASLARPYGKEIYFNPTIRMFQPVEEKSDFEGIVVFPHAFAALYHHFRAFEWGDSKVVQIIRNPDHLSITIEAGPTSYPFRLTCPCGTGGFPSPEIHERLFENPAALSFVLRHSEMAVGRGIIPQCEAFVLPKHHRLLLGDWGLYFLFRLPQNPQESELSAFTFKFPKYSGWAAPGSIKIDIRDNTARLERSGLRAYCDTRPIEDPLCKCNISGQPVGFLRVRATDAESQLSRFDQVWVSISLSEGRAEATVDDKEGNEESISPFGGYNGVPCKMKIAIKNLRKALNAGFCEFEVRRGLPDSPHGLYLLGKVRVPQTEPRLFEGERREHPTEVEVFIFAARDDTGTIEPETPDKEAAT